MLNMNHYSHKFVQKNDIIHRTIAPYNHQQNGMAKRENRA